MSEYILDLTAFDDETLDDGLREEIVRCRDCKYYDDEPDMESLGEKCWRDPDHTGHSTPTIANGFCHRAERKEVDNAD